MNRVTLVSGTTIRDVYEQTVGLLGDNGGHEPRSLDELRAVIQAAGLRYEDAARLSVSSDWLAGLDVAAEPETAAPRPLTGPGSARLAPTPSSSRTRSGTRSVTSSAWRMWRATPLT